MRLVDGAQHIAGDLPSSRTVFIDIPLEAGDDLGSDVARLSSIIAVRDAQLRELRTTAAEPDSWALTIGGDTGVELGSVGFALERFTANDSSSASSSGQGDVAVLWFSAHPALHTPESSRAGSFQSMVLRTLLGDGDTRLVPSTPLPVSSVVLVGARAFDDAEADFARESGMRAFAPGEVTPDGLVDALVSTGASTVYIHVDLDVLDPADVSGVGEPEPFGLSAVAVVELIKAVTQRFTVVGAGLTGFAPGSEEQALDDQPTILRIIGALTH
jgi:arginase